MEVSLVHHTCTKPPHRFVSLRSNDARLTVWKYVQSVPQCRKKCFVFWAQSHNRLNADLFYCHIEKGNHLSCTFLQILYWIELILRKLLLFPCYQWKCNNLILPAGEVCYIYRYIWVMILCLESNNKKQIIIWNQIIKNKISEHQ